MPAPSVTVAEDQFGNIVCTDTAATVTTTTPATLTILPAHRWAGTAEHAQVIRDQLLLALNWLEGRHVDQSTLSAGSKSAPHLPTGKTTLFNNTGLNR